jgi:hypothetical protein
VVYLLNTTEWIKGSTSWCSHSSNLVKERARGESVCSLHLEEGVITNNVEINTGNMVSGGKTVSHGRIFGCVQKANKLLGVVSGHKGTNPSLQTVAMVMRLRMDVEAQFFCVEDGWHYFPGRRKFGAIVDKALSKSKEFLDRLSDVDSIFRRSKTSCFGLAGGILNFVGRDGGAAVTPEQIGEIERMREPLLSKTSSMKGAWDNLIQCSINHDDTMVFHKISKIMWATEEVADKALFASEDFLRSWQYKGDVVIDGAGDTMDNVLEGDVGVENKVDAAVPEESVLAVDGGNEIDAEVPGGTVLAEDMEKKIGAEIPGEYVLAGDVENEIDANFDSGESQRSSNFSALSSDKEDNVGGMETRNHTTRA